ncbi:MAG TPA: RNA methyltransferase [Candidatus Acidoferrales bacterium]|nr:RNA methyltransferase [Candidatus Acidoferrales bacterium]
MPLSTDIVRSLLRRKGRREHGLFLLEGPSLLDEALKSQLAVLEVRATTEAGEAARPLLQRARTAGAELVEISSRSLDRLSDLESPPGIIAVARTRTRPVDELLALPGLLLLLAGVADPGNAGTLVRTAEAFGAAGVIFGEGGVEPYHPKVVRAAMGSLFRLPHGTAASAGLAAGASRAGRAIIAADREGSPLPGFSFPPNPVIAIGSERGGVAAWLPDWDSSVAIPHAGPTESLNAAVAGAIVLYEWSFSPRFRPKI